MRKALIVDLDGTLADCSHRINKAKDPISGKIDWQIFYDRMEDDVLVGKVRDFVEPFRSANHAIVILTGRPITHLDQTKDWLEAVGFAYDDIFLRSESDRRPAPAYKKSMLTHYILPTYNVALAIDDDPRVVAMFHSLSIPCVSPSKTEHTQKPQQFFDQIDVYGMVGKVVANHLVEAFLNENRVPPDTQIGWVRDFSVKLSRSILTALGYKEGRRG